MRNQLMSVEIPGQPRPQGSMALWSGPDGRERAKYPQHTVAHRNLAISLIRKVWGRRDPHLGPVALDVVFFMPRPMSHFGTGRNAGQVKSSASPHPVTLGRNDTDKMVRLVGDALAIAGVIKDDSQIVRILAIKAWEPHSGNGYTTLALAEAPPYEYASVSPTG